MSALSFDGRYTKPVDGQEILETTVLSFPWFNKV